MVQLTRRQWHRLTIGGVAAAAGSALPWVRPRPAAAESRFGGVLIGVQSYSFRDMDLEQSIAAMQQLGITSCELFSMHVEPRELYRRENRERLRQWRASAPLDHFRDIAARFDEAGIGLNSYNLSFRDDFSDAEIARGFEMALALSVPVITASAQLSTVPRIARYAEMHGMPVAMHNHSWTDPNEFGSPDDFDRAIRIGGSAPIAVNLDIGHMTAANYDPLAYLKANHQRVVTLHLKDRKRDQGPQRALGRGRHPDPRGAAAAARRGLGHPRQHRVRVPRAATPSPRSAAAWTIARQSWSRPRRAPRGRRRRSYALGATARKRRGLSTRILRTAASGTPA